MPKLDPCNHGEGQTFLGFTNVTTDASGNASFNNVVLPAAPAGQTFVAATATDGDGNTSEFSGAVENTPLPASSDLSISMSAAPSPVGPGGTETYTITVTNNGPDTAHTVSVTTAVPTSTTFVSFASPSGWTASTPAAGGAGTVSATIPQLGHGDSATFSFDVRVNDATLDGAVLTADGAVTSDTSDPDTSNNHASAQAVVSAPIENTDLAITATATPDPGHSGSAPDVHAHCDQQRSNRRHERDPVDEYAEPNNLPGHDGPQRMDHADPFRRWDRQPLGSDRQARCRGNGRLHGHHARQFHRTCGRHDHRRGEDRIRDRRLEPNKQPSAGFCPPSLAP